MPYLWQMKTNNLTTERVREVLRVSYISCLELSKVSGVSHNILRRVKEGRKVGDLTSEQLGSLARVFEKGGIKF
jgi:hypothetical protein